MIFQNLPIPPEQLPAAAELELKPVDPKYLQVLFWQNLIGWLVLLAGTGAAIFFLPGWRQSWVLIAAPAGLLLLATLGWRFIQLSFRYKAYALREHDLVYRSGWLIRSVRVCPFNRIQHCSMDAGVLERRYGLASLSVFTAGGMQADLKLPGLPQEEAARLREFILSKINRPAGD
jgi:membrane protein YdbS with pleckstrin-like domain